MRYSNGALRIFVGASLFPSTAASYCDVAQGVDGACVSIDEVTSLLQFQGFPDGGAGRKEEVMSAAELQKQLGISKESRRSFVSRLMSHVTVIAKQGSTPEALVVASEELEQVYLVAWPSLNAEHLNDKRLLRGLFDAFGSTASELLHSEANLRELESRSETARSEHLQCRKEESTRCKQRAKCEAELEEVKGTLNFLEERSETKDEDDFQRDFESWASKKTLNDKSDECMSHREKCTDITDLCGVKQKMLEVSSCAAGQQVDLMRLHYADNFTTADSTYQEAASEVQVEEANRKAELEMLQELHCVQQKFAAGLDSIDECRSMQHDISNLNIVYQEAPARVALPAVVARPCTQEYVSVAYGSLPSGAPAAACKTCSEWEPDVTKLQAEVASHIKSKAHATIPSQTSSPPAQSSRTNLISSSTTVKPKHEEALGEFQGEGSAEFKDGYAEGYQSGVETFEHEVSSGMASVDFGDATEAFEAAISKSSDASFEHASEIPGPEYGSHKDLAKGFATGFQKGFSHLRQGVQKSIQKARPGPAQADPTGIYGKHQATIERLLIMDFEGGYEEGLMKSVEKASPSTNEDLRQMFWGTFQQRFESTVNRGFDASEGDFPW